MFKLAIAIAALLGATPAFAQTRTGELPDPNDQATPSASAGITSSRL
jgi:hypothetical protein